MMAVCKQIVLFLYAAATFFVCLTVFSSATGNYDKSTEGLLPLLFVGTETLYFVIVTSVYTVAYMRGGGNLKMFYAISAVPILLAYGSFICRDFVFADGWAGTAAVLLTILCAPLFFSFRMNLRDLCGITFILLYVIIKIYFGRDNILPLFIFLLIVPLLTVIKFFIQAKQHKKAQQQTAL